MIAPAATRKTKVSVLSLLFFALSLFLTAYSNRNPQVAKVGAKFVLAVLAPLESGISQFSRGVDSVFDRYFLLVAVEDENERLRQEVNELSAENSELWELRSENLRLSKLLDLKKESALDGVVAQVIGWGASGWVNSLVIDRGTESGIREGSAVIQKQGIVGQVVSTTRGSSKVLLITDPASGVDALLRETRARGVVLGDGGGGAVMDYVLAEERVEKGQIVVTGGTDGVYPKGLVIGTVEEIQSRQGEMFQRLAISPQVDMNRIETVLVVTRISQTEDEEEN
ncbi:MAG: rod shape-determining protein MreC [Bdellovibrionales bacterium]|nr:rod shape-determining protein MreC [Bdellovibrionales bacterium]